MAVNAYVFDGKITTEVFSESTDWPYTDNELSIVFWLYIDSNTSQT